jgi:predicted phosphodiesterase
MAIIALLPDIHANLSALQAVLHEVDSLNVDDIICCGDIVGYGSEPAPCVRLLRERHAKAVFGNHDAMALFAKHHPSQVPAWESSRNDPVWKGIHQAVADLSHDDFSWLASLPRVLEIPGAIVAHAALHGGDGWPYLLDTKHARPTLDLLKRRGHAIGFFGHTHRQEWFSQPGDPANEPRETSGFPLDESTTYAVTTGSVGRPRGQDVSHTWTIWDSGKRVFEFNRDPRPIQHFDP